MLNNFYANYIAIFNEHLYLCAEGISGVILAIERKEWATLGPPGVQGSASGGDLLQIISVLISGQ